MFGLTRRDKNIELWNAIRSGDVDKANKALRKGADANSDYSNESCILYEALQLSKEGAKLAIVTALLDKGADITKNDRIGRPPLVHLIEKGYGYHLKVAGKLLEAGAAVNDGRALNAALQREYWEAAGIILDHLNDTKTAVSSGMNFLAAALEKGAPLQLVQRLLELPVDVNAENGGMTALYLAVVKDRTDVVQLLLSRPGIDLNAVNAEQGTPLLEAVVWDRRDIVEALVRAGANLEIANENGFYPLLSAVQGDKQEIAEILIAAGAPLNTPDAAGVTPVVRAAGQGSVRMVVTLLAALEAAGEKPDLQPALLAASEQGKGRIIELLVAAGTDVNAADAEGRTPLMKAALSDQVEAMSILIKAGAKTEASDRSGMRAYDHALGAGKSQSKDYLARYRSETVRPAAGGVLRAEENRFVALNKDCLEVREGENLTMIFNFWTQQVIFRDPSQGSPLTVQNFADLQRQEAIGDAYRRLKELGGDPPEPAAASLQKRAAALGKG